MSDYVALYFAGFGIGLCPALFFFLIVSAFRGVVECAELAAN